jgi:hypothetical protein
MIFFCVCKIIFARTKVFQKNQQLSKKMFIALSFRPTQNENYHVYKWFGLSLGKSNDIMILGSLKPILQQLVFFDY